jgi:hypothetical protein
MQLKGLMKNPISFAPFHLSKVTKNIQGRVGVPILLYALGVPGGLVLLLWFFIFRG